MSIYEDYIKSKDNIDKIRSKYHEVQFRSAITYLMDVGKEQFKDAGWIVSVKENIKRSNEEIEAKGHIPLATNEFQYEIVDCAKELSDIPNMDLLAYVQNEVVIDVGQPMRLDKAEKIIERTISMLYDTYVNGDKYDDFIEQCQSCGISLYDLDYFGYGDVVNEYMYEQNQDEPDICD